MSDGTQDLDLAALARAEDSVDRPRRSWLRIAVPLLAIGAFGFLLRDTLVELVRPRPEVELARPVRIGSATPGAGGDEADAPERLAVQAAGWIEPDPFPVMASALTPGVLEEVLVQEADVVEAGAPVAQLVSEDAELAVQRLRADVDVRAASLEAARARAGIAAERFDEAVEVTEALALAEADVAAGEAALAAARDAVREGRAAVSIAASEIEVQRELDAAGAAGARQVELAEADLEYAEAKLARLVGEVGAAEAALDRARATLVARRRDVELRLDDRLERDLSAAERGVREGELAAARAALAEAELMLARTTVVAPRGGVVLERLAAPGEALGAGSAVASLYDPESLRVRVDVSQGDVAKVRVGQRAEVLADVRPDRPYAGEVIRIVERADIQKVTLEAQVRILDGDGLLGPDMLTQVRFYERGRGGAGAGEAAPAEADVRIGLAPELLDGRGRAWVYDPVARVARRRELELGERVTLADGREVVEVLGGLGLTDEVVGEGRERVTEAAGGGDEAPVRVRETELGAAGRSEGGQR